MTGLRSVLLLALVLALAACASRRDGRRIVGDAGPGPRDGGAADAGWIPDGGGRDAGGLDAGPRDAGAPDAGIDAGPPDAGSDAGTDSGPPDAGFDAGSLDAGPGSDYAVGGRSRSWTTTGYWRGNVYLAGSSTTLLHFQAYLGLSGTCELGWYVFTSSSVSGPHTRVWSTSTTSSGTGYHDSGPIDLATTPGLYYTLGVGWDCSTTYYSAEYDTMTGTSAGFGTLEGNASNNSYPGYTLGFTPSGSRAGGAHYDQIVTVSP